MNDNRIEQADNEYAQLQKIEWLLRKNLSLAETQNNRHQPIATRMERIHDRMIAIDFEQELYEEYLSGYQN